MKKYINSFFLLATLLVAGMAFVSCEKENDSVEGTFTMSVNAVKGGSNASKALGIDGTGLHATWTAGDVVKVYKGSDEVGSLAAATSGASTKLTGSITGSISQGDDLTLEFLSPNYTMQDGTLDYIAENCDYAVANVTVASISGSEIRITGSSATFENRQAIVKFTLLDKANNADLNTNVLSVEVDSYIYAVIPASATNVFYVALPAISGEKVSLFAKTSAGWYSYAQAGVSFANGQYYTVGAKLAQTGMLPGVFSVGASEKVHFSQGNLQATTTDSWSTWTFSFMEHQYSTVETNGEPYCTDNYGDKDAVSFFGWGTSGYDHRTTVYQPYSTSTWGDDYLAYDDSDYSLSDGNGTADWGYNAISNGGNSEDLWHTPSSDNWDYLFNNEAKYGYATVGDVTGIILLPDNFTDPKTNGGSGAFVNANATEYSSNVYTAGANWDAMEAAGAVFLPAAGRRNGTDVSNVGNGGCYWSSTVLGWGCAVGVGFDHDIDYGCFVGILYSTSDNGYSVRLVR